MHFNLEGQLFPRLSHSSMTEKDSFDYHEVSQLSTAPLGLTFFLLLFSQILTLCVKNAVFPRRQRGPETRSVDTDTVNIHKYGLTGHFPVPKIHTFKTRLDLSCENEFYL